MFFIQGIPCFNSNKKRGEMGHWGFEHGSPKHEPSGLPVRRAIFCVGIGQLNFLYIIVETCPALKNACVIHPFLFNPQLNFVISISPS